MSGLLALLIFFAVSAISDARDLPLVRIGQSSITDVQVASIVTQQAGIFGKYGLDTELVLLQGGPLTVQALISGSIDPAFFVDSTPVKKLETQGFIDRLYR